MWPQYQPTDVSDHRLDLEDTSFAIREQRNRVSPRGYEIKVGRRAFHRPVEIKCLPVGSRASF